MKKIVMLAGCLCAIQGSVRAMVVDDPSTLFQLTQSDDGEHPNQVNVFRNVGEVHQKYAQTKSYPWQLCVSPSSKEEADKVAFNEIAAIFHYLEINPTLRALVSASKKYEPKEQLASFRKLFLDENVDEIHRLTDLAYQVLQWQGFFTKTSIEFVTDYTCRAGRLIDNLNAFFFARHLGTEQTVPANAWQTFTDTNEYQRTLPLRTFIEHISRPTESGTLPTPIGKEGMSIAAALRAFRGNLDYNTLLVQEGNRKVEDLFEQKFLQVREKFATMRGIIDQYPTVQDAYKALAASQAEGRKMENMETANNIRREIGGTGLLSAFMQAVKARLISQRFFRTHLGFIAGLVKLTNEMDKCNFEIVLKYGEYKDDNIPSAYPFFQTLLAKFVTK